MTSSYPAKEFSLLLEWMDAMSEDKYEKCFQVAQPAKVNVSNIRGSVEILSGQDGTIQVTAVKNTHSGDGRRTEIEISKEADGTVRVTTHFPEGGWNWLFGSRACNVDYIVKVPHECSLKVNNFSSTLCVKGIEGACDVKSVSGDIALHDLKGTMHIHTISGEIDGENIAGPLNLETISGDMTLKGSSLPSIDARTVSGSLHAQTQLTDGPYHFRSISGDVHLTLPPMTRCTAELHTVSGDLISAFPIQGYIHDHGNQTINVQGGGVNLSLNSVSGNLSLDSNEEIPPDPAVTGSANAKDRRKVLAGIERGELTVEEGLIELKG
jgi:hypothetical protein